MKLLDIEDALAQIRKAMGESLAQFERLNAAHDHLYCASIGHSTAPDAQLTIRQVALLFGLPAEELFALTTRNYTEQSFSVNEFGQMTIAYADAMRLFLPESERRGEDTPPPMAVEAVRYLSSLPGMSDRQIAVAIGLTWAQLQKIKSRIEIERVAAIDALLATTCHSRKEDPHDP